MKNSHETILPAKERLRPLKLRHPGKWLCLAFIPQGFVCDETENGFQAITKAKTFSADLVILDLAMPAMNGFEAAMVFQREMPKVPVVILTMYADNGQFGSTLAHTFGVKVIIPKAEGMDALMNCVRKLLA